MRVTAKQETHPGEGCVAQMVAHGSHGANRRGPRMKHRFSA